MSSNRLLSWPIPLLALALLVAAGCSNTASGPSTTGPGGGWQVPGGDTVGSKQDTTTQPKPDAESPEEDTENPGEDVENPGEDIENPGEDVENPGEDVENPGEDVETPPEDATTPPEDVQADPDGAAQPDTTKPDTTKPDASQPDATTPDTSKPDSSKPVCIDEDGDDFGENCANGVDCDDYNPNFNTFCPDCSKGNLPGCPCKGKSAPCYSGDPASVGKGECKSGVQLCDVGFWTECSGEVLPGLEMCNGKDDDCDGQVDEGVKSTCGTCDTTCNQQSVGSDQNNKFNLTSENSTGVGMDPNGNLVLDTSQISLNLKFIWIANSPQSTVSKLDCKTGQEVGRFSVCSDPSRTSVDLQGNVWVGCRGDGKVAKIIAEKKNCIDKNGNGIIETSTNSTVVGNDECIKFVVQPDGSTIARAAGVDKDNHVWMGFWSSSNLRRLHPDNGATVDTINIGCNPYGLVIDQKGIIWVQGAGCGKLVRVDPATKKIDKYSYAAGAYGINVDKYGHIWVASGNKASRFDTKALTWTTVTMGCSGGRGIATSNDGYVYPACDGSGGAGKINGNANPPVFEGFIKGGGYPVGAALDYDGYVWVVNQGGSSASKLDPKTMTAVGTYPVGSSPYTYSDMTGYTLNYFTAPKGQYSTVFFGPKSFNPITSKPVTHIWQTISADADLPEGTSLKIRVRAANTKDKLEMATWSDSFDFPPKTFPFDLTAINITGDLLQVEVQLITNDKKVSPTLKSLTAKSKLLQLP